MGYLLEVICLSVITAGCICLGIFLSRCKGSWWILGAFVSILLTGIITLSHFLNEQILVFLLGTGRFYLLSAAVTLGMCSCTPRLKNKSERILTGVLMWVFLLIFSFAPIVSPLFARQELARIETRIDSSGICRQSLDYTCGPAAAVTAIRKFGLEANESEIAILAKSNPITGTLPLNLFNALKKRYSDDGLRCSFRMLDSVKQFQNSGVILTVVRDSFLRDHCVVVMEVCRDKVLLADPSFGRVLMTPSQFEKVWRHKSIIITRDSDPEDTKAGAI